MKSHLLRSVFGALLFGPILVVAQVSISSSLPADTFLLYEGIPVRIEVTNTSGTDLILQEDDEDNQLVLRVRDTTNQIIPRTKRPILAEPWIIKNGETEAKEFDLVQLFHIRQAKSFRGLQHVVVDGETHAGPPLLFTVSRGMLFDDVKMSKNDRVFSLFGLNRGRGDVLLLRVTNKDKSMTLATYFLERHLRFYPPHIKSNQDGEVATLHYMSPNQAVLCVFNADGTPVKREYYQVSPGVPVRLHPHEETSFTVEGGTPVSDGN